MTDKHNLGGSVRIMVRPALLLGVAIMTSCSQNTSQDLNLTQALPGQPQASIRYQIAENITTARATGRSAWATGRSAWATGDPATLVDNRAIWTQIHLQQAQTLAPHWGAGIKVAVIDTGIDLNHPAFVRHLAPSTDWKDFVDNDTTPQEIAGGEAYGHGTSVASIVLQVAPKALIMPIRVLDSSGIGDTSKIASAIDWAAQHGAKVINLSLGTDAANFDCAVQKSVALAIQNYGTLMVFAAGNTGDTNINYPAITVKSNPNGNPAVKACIPAPYNLTPPMNEGVNVASVSVGSVNSLDQKSDFSSYGDKLEMVSPGENIFGPYPENSAAAWSGTSMATPLVSGALALALGEKLRSGVKVTDLPNILIGKTDKVDSLNPSLGGQIGKGRLNIENFLKSVF